MKIKISNNNLDIGIKGQLNPPSNRGDAGYDLVAQSHPKVVGDVYQGFLFKSIEYIEYETNISIQPNQDEFGDYEFFSLLFPRSSISNYNLSLCNSVGIIDSGYRNTIKIRFNYIPQPENYTILNSKHLLLAIDKSKVYSKGDKIAQLVFAEHIHPKMNFVENLDGSQRDKGGFGSTGI
jgi:dUTPase